jgi:hypothetical protein
MGDISGLDPVAETSLFYLVYIFLVCIGFETPYFEPDP